MAGPALAAAPYKWVKTPISISFENLKIRFQINHKTWVLETLEECFDKVEMNTRILEAFSPDNHLSIKAAADNFLEKYFHAYVNQMYQQL